jgi:HTH-type transcriptional regulator, competence development regulator
MSDVGQEIRRLREAKGWSQPKLAVEAGVAVSGVSQIENGKRNPDSSTLVKLARALDVDVRDFFPKTQTSLPLENGKLIDRADVKEWLRANGHMPKDDFLAWAEDLEDEADIEQAILDLRAKRDELRSAVRTSDAREALFPMPPGLSREETRNWLLKPPGLWELRNEIQHEYLARELALVNYSKELFVLGRSSGYLGYGPPEGHAARDRHQKIVEARRAFEESYAKALAV